jgi:hypothetical protein
MGYDILVRADKTVIFPFGGIGGMIKKTINVTTAK